MKVYPLAQEQMNEKGATHCGEITWQDFVAADTGNTKTFNLAPVVAKQGLQLTHVELPEVFVSSDGTLISTAITIGDSGSANRFLTTTELNLAGTEVFLKGTALAGASAVPFVYTAGDNLQVAFTATAAKALNTHTAGKVLVYFRLWDVRPQP